MFSLASISALMSPKSWKILGGVVTSLIILGFVLAIVIAFKTWNVETYNNGFKAGSDMVRKQWADANAAGLKKQRDQVVQDSINSNAAVIRYLDDIRKMGPLLAQINDRTAAYEKSSLGSQLCLDADGVQLLEGNRAALGYPASPPASTPAPVSGVVPTSKTSGKKR